MTMGPQTTKDYPTLRKFLTPNPFQALIAAAVLVLILAIFIFGAHGPHPSQGLEDLLKTIGIGTLAAAVSILVDRGYVLRHFEFQMKKSLEEASGVAKSLLELGIHGALEPFDFTQIFREARRGELVRWLDTYCPRQNEFVAELTRALERGVHVNMLIIDPTCENAKYRNQELASTVDSGEGWVAGLNVFIAKMKALQDAHANRFAIRFYSDLPCAPMYLVGTDKAPRKGFFSIFLVRATAECAHLELDGGAWLADMGRYFDGKWERQSGTWPQEFQGAIGGTND